MVSARDRLKQAMGRLIEEGTKKGSLSLDDINYSLPMEAEPDDIDQLLSELESRGVHVVERAATARLPIAPEDELSGKYLRTVWSVPLLSRSDELELARRIRTQRHVRLANALACRSARKYLIDQMSAAVKGLESIWSLFDLHQFKSDVQQVEQEAGHLVKQLRSIDRSLARIHSKQNQRHLSSEEAQKLSRQHIDKVGELRCLIEDAGLRSFTEARLSQHALEMGHRLESAERTIADQEALSGQDADAVRDAQRSIRRIQQQADMSSDELKSCCRKINDATKRIKAARDQFVVANQKLVVYVARSFGTRGVPFLDLVQEGSRGLMRAAERFDDRKGYRFATYAYYWVRQSILRAIANQDRTIRIPVHIRDAVRKMLHAERKLAQELGRSPLPEEIAEAIDREPREVVELYETIRRPLSLDVPVGEDEDASLRDIIVDQRATSPLEELEQAGLAREVGEALKRLMPREREVIERRFGLGDHSEQTLAEIGRFLKVTRERARQIQARALKQLLRIAAERDLREYLEE